MVHINDEKQQSRKTLDNKYATEQRNSNALAYNIKGKWENQAKKTGLRLAEGKNETICRIDG
jgi:hypothetical protein